MKFAFLSVVGSKEPYATHAEETLIKKIDPIVRAEILPIKAKSAERADAAAKKIAESREILNKLGPDDYVWVFDEGGLQSKDSKEFSKWLVHGIESGKRRMVFIIGGAYGVGEDIRQRANRVVSLSSLTFNHHVAKIVAMEQIYRGLAIWKNLPYHNE